MTTFAGAITRGALAMAGRRSPWGGGVKGDGPADDEAPEPQASGDEPASEQPTGEAPEGPAQPPRGPRNPWLPPNDTPPRRTPSIDEIFRSREQRKGRRPGGGGGPSFPKLPRRPDGKSWFPLAVAAIVLVWLGVTSWHVVGTKEEGIVTTFGKYSHTVEPGVAMTLPWPIQDVSTTDVYTIKRDTVPEGEGEKLMLTSDQNLVDLSYLVRWNIKDLKLYTYQLADPDETVREVAEAAMRASIAEVPLSVARSGAGRAQIEQSVRQRMQGLLDAYRSGVQIQGVDIKKADPPAKTLASFQQVTAAQQDAQRVISKSQAYAQQLVAQAQGQAAAFDKVYEQYKLAPDVTRRRMYYETMEAVLANNDKVIVNANGLSSYLPLPQIVKKPPNPPAATTNGDDGK
jgi:membrane protease subunit HflK